MAVVSAWRDFYLMAGGSIAALTGLLFVAMSIHLDQILARRKLTRDVSIALYGMLYQLLFCGFMLVPGVTLFIAGLVVTGSGLGWSLTYLLFSRGGRRLDAVTNSGMGILSAAVGVLMLLGLGWSLYLNAIVIGTAVAGLVRLCWRLLTMALRDLRPEASGETVRAVRRDAAPAS